MAKRLQVVVQDLEFREIERAASSLQMSIAEWVRQAIGHALHRESLGEVEKKLAALRAAVKHESPTADIDTMLAEIEQGYLTDQS